MACAIMYITDGSYLRALCWRSTWSSSSAIRAAAASVMRWLRALASLLTTYASMFGSAPLPKTEGVDSAAHCVCELHLNAPVHG